MPKYHTVIMRYMVVAFLLVAGPVVCDAQHQYKALLLSVHDSTVLPNAAIKVSGNENVVITNEKGEFSFVAGKSQHKVSMSVTAIGVKTDIEYYLTHGPVEKVYVAVVPNQLDEFTFVALSAEDVVRKAVAAIPNNYADSSYFSYSSYRQYEAIDGKYCNLVEAKPVVMFHIGRKSGQIQSREAFAVTKLRRSDFNSSDPGGAYNNNPVDLFKDNPVYHMANGSLDPRRFDHYRFEYDTTLENDEYYVIKYTSDEYSTETHGIENLRDAFRGESWETGSIVIDKATFAISHMTRAAHRHKAYNYPKNNNFLHPKILYFVEFVDGLLSVDYELQNNKWYLKKLNHQYTNDFFSTTVKISPRHTVTCFFEWTSDSLSRFVTEEHNGRFYNKMDMVLPHYDSDFWQVYAFPFILADKDAVYSDLSRRRPLDRQFADNVSQDGK